MVFADDDGGYSECDAKSHDMPPRSLALLASFRHESGPTVEVVRANVSYLTRDAEIVQRVDFGCWLGEEVNWASFHFGETKHLVIAVIGDNGAFAADDSRDDVSLERVVTLRRLDQRAVFAYVTLTMLNEEFEALGGRHTYHTRFVIDLGDGKKKPSIEPLPLPEDMT